MSTPVNRLPAAPELEPPSFGSKLLGVFFSPGETFAQIARQPDWIAPLILLLLVTVSVSEAVLAKIGVERLVRASIEQSGRASQMTAEQMQQAIQQGARFAAIFGHVSFVFLGLGLIFWALVGWAIVQFVFGAQSNFKTTFAVSTYAHLVNVVGALMALAMVFFGDPERFNPNSPAPTNLGFFLDRADTPKPLYALATSLDIFWIWFLLLLGLGFSKVSGGKAKTAWVCLILFGLWGVWVLVKVGLAVIF